MKAPRPRPSYANAGANRDRPRLLPSEGPALRRALDKAGVASMASVATVEDDVQAIDADYQSVTEKGQADGYAELDGTGKVPTAQMATGTPDGTKFLRDDRTWVAGGAGVTDHGALTGLADDDHTQYALADGSRGTFEASGAVATHAAAADPHTGYQKESEKGAANGYASLGAGGLVPIAQLASGTPDGTKFIRDDGTLAAAGGSAYTLVATLASDATTGANTTPIDLTGLVFSYAANSTYRIWFMGRVDPAAATTGCGFQFNLSSTVTQVCVSFYHQLANTGTLTGGHSIADDASVGVSSGLPGTSEYPVVGHGLLRTNGNTGTAQLRFRSETTAAITCKAGMTLVVEKVA